MGSYGFRRTRSGTLVARFDRDDREVMQAMVRSLTDLVAPEPVQSEDPLADLVGIDPEATPPTDPVLARLLPDGYDSDEPEAAEEFRRFTERGLREGKVAHAARVLACLDRAEEQLALDGEDAAAWLGCLNDLRLVLGTRLEVDEDPDEMDRRIEALGRTVLADRDAGGEVSPVAQAALEQLAAHQAYDWLTMLQEQLVRALSEG